MKRKVLLVMLAILLSACSRIKLPSQPSETAAQFYDHQIVPARLGDKELQLEIVSSPTAITQGLSGRPELGSDGLLFVLPVTTTPQFWMKDMQFDLDLIWLKDFEVIGITPNVPKPNPGTNLQDLPLYPPPSEVNMVLETEAGKAAEWGISPGARLQVK